MKAASQILTTTLYNLGFFGGNRETINVDGQYKVITDLKEFIILKVGGYGNLTSFPEVENPVVEVLDKPSYRFVHDALIENLRQSRYRGESSEAETKMFNESKRYKIHKSRISANIDYGDKVIHLETKDTFVVAYGHDVQYINRNHQYKLVDRELHPEPVTLEDFIKQNEAKDVFKGWDKLDAMPKLPKDCYCERYIIDGKIFKTFKDLSGPDRYIIETPDGEVFEKRTNTSAPFYDTIDILTGNVKFVYVDGSPVYHCYKDNVHESDKTTWFFPRKFVKVTEKSSYDYNTRLTHL